MLSIAHLTIDRAGPLAFIEAAAEAGFDAVGLRVVPAAGGSAHPPVAGDEAVLAELQRRLSGSGLSVLQVNSFWITPQTSVADIRPVLDAAARLRARHVLVVVSDPDLTRAAETLAACCAAAEPLHLTIALEFHSYGPVQTLQNAARIVQRSGAGNARLVIDALHLFRSGGQVSDLALVDPDRLAFVQLCDAPARKPGDEELRIEARTRRLYPGEGELPLFGLMDALPPGIPLDVEAPSKCEAHLLPREQAERAAAATRRFLALWAER